MTFVMSSPLSSKRKPISSQAEITAVFFVSFPVSPNQPGGCHGFEPRKNPSSDLLSMSLLIRMALHIIDFIEEWNASFQDKVSGKSITN